MLLRCPHCDKNADHMRSDFFGDWVVCPTCELPFAWREARMGELRSSCAANGNGAGRPTSKVERKEGE